MGWARARRRLTGWLALFALALQLGLSFGHSHAEDAAPAVAGAASVQTGGAPAAPEAPADTDHADCTICTVLHLAGALLAPAPPALVLPAIFDLARLDATAPQALPTTAAASFHARAPPQA
jgi:hypothetical protein